VFGFTRNYWIIVITWIMFFIAQDAVTPFFPNYVVALGGSELDVGLVNAISNIFFAIAVIPGGYIADRFGRKDIITRMTLLIAATDFAYALTPYWWLLPIISAFSGLSRAYIPALRAITLDSIPRDKRAVGMVLSNVIPSIAALPAPYVGGIIASSLGGITGYRVLLLISGAVGVLAALLRTRLEETLPSAARASLVQAVRESLSIGFRRFFEVVVDHSHRDVVKVILAYSIFWGFGQIMNTPYYVRYATRLGVDDYRWGIIVTLANVASTTLTLLTIPIMDRVSRRALMASSLIAASLGNLLYVNNVLLMGYTLTRIAFNLAPSGIGAYIADKVDVPLRGRISSVQLFIFQAVAGVSYVVAGALYTIDPRLLFYTSIAVALSGAIALAKIV